MTGAGRERTRRSDPAVEQPAQHFLFDAVGGFAAAGAAVLAIRAATGQEIEWLTAAGCIAAGASVLAAVPWWRRGAVPIPRPPSAP